MEKIYFYGAGNCGKKAITLYEQLYPNEKIKGFIDKKLCGTEIEGYPVFAIEEIENDAVIVICLAGIVDVVSVYLDLRKRGFRNLFYFYRRQSLIQVKDFWGEACLSCENWGRAVLPQAEIHVADYCNLNCKGCTHYSPIFEKELPDLNQRLNDIALLANKFSHIVHFYLLGGEPFLNPDICKYIEFSRQCMPDTFLTIVTNGLLIPSIEQEVFDCIRENNCEISISEYEPTHRRIRTITDILDKENVTYSIRKYDSKQVFNKPLALDGTKFEKQCISVNCVNVWNGKIARCPSLMYIDVLNQKYGLHLPNQGIMNLKDEVDTMELLKKLNAPVPLCSHCVKNPISWECCGNHAQVSDFVEV